MAPPLVLVSGFGSFEGFETNPSGELARALADAPPAGVRVRALVLPVSFARAPRAWDEGAGARPALLLGLGVASRRTVISLERFASPRLKHVPRPDVDGRSAGEFTRAGPRLETPIDLERLVRRLRARGAPRLRISRSAGGYVCQHLYHHLLASARGVPGLFVHVLREEHMPLARQGQVLRWLIEELVLGQTRVARRARRADAEEGRGGKRKRREAGKALSRRER